MERKKGPTRVTVSAAKRGAKLEKRAILQQVSRLRLFEHKIEAAGTQWNQFKQSSHDYYAEVSSTPPYLLETMSRWTSYAKELDHTTELLDSTSTTAQESVSQLMADVDYGIAHNPLTLQLNGTSVDDISRMSLPLSAPDIRRIDLMLKRRAKITPGRLDRSKNPNHYIQYIQDIVSLSATQAEYHRTTPLSDPVRMLVQRLKNYWEYYTLWALNSDKSVAFLMKMGSGGQLLWGLTSFIPARLHLSPSSTYRLFDAHVENVESAIFRYITRHLLLGKMALFLNNVPNPKGLPQSIANSQFTDVQTETGLTKKLQQAYQDRATKAKIETTDSAEITRALVQKLSPLYHKHLRRSILASRDGFIRLSPAADNFFKEILVGAFYGRTLSIIGLAEGEETFVTLDLVQSGQLFGVPPQLARRDSNSANLLIQDLLNPVLEEARARTPWLESAPLPRNVPEPEYSKTVVTETSKSKKRRALRALEFITNRSRMPEFTNQSLPPEEKEEKDNYLLIYKDQVVDNQDTILLAKKLADDLIPNDQRLQNDIKLILESLVENPHGPGTYKITAANPIIEESGRRMPLRSFRGDARKLPFQYKSYSDRLRTVYYIDPKLKSVTLIEVMTHDRFDNLFTHGNNH